MGDQVKQVLDALTPLANKLQQGAGEVFAIYVKQAFAVGVMEVLAGAILIVLPVVYGRWVWRSWNSICDRDWEAVTVVGAMACGIAFVIGLIMLPDGVLHLLSPQYYALHELLCSVKSCGGN
jgi:predicted phage tail protein